MESRIESLKGVDWCVVLQAPGKFEVDCHIESVSLRVKDGWDLLDVFESILEKDKNADLNGKYGRGSGE